MEKFHNHNFYMKLNYFLHYFYFVMISKKLIYKTYNIISSELFDKTLLIRNIIKFRFNYLIFVFNLSGFSNISVDLL